MIYRAAIASTDGKVVNQHFGRAEQFQIFDISDDNSFKYVERRAVSPCCHGGEHETDAFSRVGNILNDVSAVIVSRIGEGASEFLESNGFVVYEAPYPIEPLMQKIIKERLYEADKWQYHTTS